MGSKPSENNAQFFNRTRSHCWASTLLGEQADGAEVKLDLSDVLDEGLGTALGNEQLL